MGSASWPRGTASRGAASSQSMISAPWPPIRSRRSRVATNMEIAAARFLAGCWRFKVGRRKFTDGCAVRPFC
jgi:hypothetical protein